VHAVQLPGVRVRRHETPGTVDEALALLAEHGPVARPIAGGTDLLLELARRVRPELEVLVDLSRIDGLGTVDVDGDVLRLGALVTHNQVVASDDVVRHALPLAQASFEIGAPALRNRATVVGNVVTASPANDTITALWALGATLVLRSTSSERRVPLRELFTGIRRTVLVPGELVTAIEIPILGDARGMFVKLGQRRAQAISIVHLAVVLGVDDGTVTRADLALGSVAPTVVAATEAQAFLLGRPLEDDVIAEAARLAAAGVRPIDDVRATAEYRTDEVEVMVRRTLTTLRRGQERDRWPSAPVLLGGPAVTGEVHRASHGPTTPVSCTVNGEDVDAAGATGRTLLEWLRDEAGLTGTKEGCAEGECGACTVHLDGTAVLACLVPAVRANGSEVTTIEGLAGGRTLHPLQEAFVEEFAVQCGFCIPGFLMSGERLLQEVQQPTREQIAQGLAGNLCRCTGYYRFYDAVERAGRS
jgi:carbon-monoxide dehydrogenase medium subunit